MWGSTRWHDFYHAPRLRTHINNDRFCKGGGGLTPRCVGSHSARRGDDQNACREGAKQCTDRHGYLLSGKNSKARRAACFWQLRERSTARVHACQCKASLIGHPLSERYPCNEMFRARFARAVGDAKIISRCSGFDTPRPPSRRRPAGCRPVPRAHLRGVPRPSHLAASPGRTAPAS